MLRVRGILIVTSELFYLVGLDDYLSVTKRYFQSEKKSTPP